MATMKQPSVEEISADFLRKQTRTTDAGTITTEVKDVRVYPFDTEWCLRITSGEPFPDNYIRLPLGMSRSKAFETLLDFYPTPFEGLDQLTFQNLELDFDTNHTVGGPPEAVEELETAVLLNGRKATLGKLPQSHEYHFDKREDREEVQDIIEDEVIFYRDIPKKIETRTDVQISDIEPIDERTLMLYLNGFVDDRKLPVKLTLPSIDAVSDHPVSEFIQSVGSGKVENLEDGFVYIYEQDKAESVVGTDVRFEKYGVSATPIDTSNNQGFLSRLL